MSIPDYSCAEYLSFPRHIRKQIAHAMLNRASKVPVKQMTNKQILREYFTKTGRVRKQQTAVTQSNTPKE